MHWESSKDAMPWVGLYVAIASSICTLTMAADAIKALWRWKLWFPNSFFTLNASTTTLIAIAMKLPVDLSTDKEVCGGNILYVKMVGIFFLITMLANFLPSLGLMDDRELLMNIVALGILLTTVAVNIGIQTYSYNMFMHPLTLPIFIFAYLWPFSVALTVSEFRKRLEHRYKESQQLVSSYQEKMFSFKGLVSYVKKYWVMTETRNPQFVIACSPVSCAFGVICILLSLLSFGLPIIGRDKDFRCDNSDYSWSIYIIVVVQSVGTLVGSIAPISRCFSSVGHYNLSKEWTKNHLNVFRVEKHWIQRLQKWKRRHVHSYIPGRHCKIVFHYIKNTFLNLCITLHILVLVICKTLCLVPMIFLILLSYFWCLFKSCLKRVRTIVTGPNENVNSEIEEYIKYVVQIEENVRLSDRILRNTLRYITKLLKASEKKEPRNLMVLLEKSTGFSGVAWFESEKVRPLYDHEEETLLNCWSLVLVTLTSIAIALPNVAYGHVDSLLSSMREAFQMVRDIEECLNGDNNTLEKRKATKRVWAEVEVHRSWLQINLQKMARKGKSSREVVKWLGDEAEKITREFKSNTNSSIDQSPYKFILASCMYRISRSMLVQYDEEESWSNGEKLFEWISTMIADILFACFTNLPQVIKLKCEHHMIEKRGESIRKAAKLLGKSKKVLKILKGRQLPNMDHHSMAYIDKWHVALKNQMPNESKIHGGGVSSSFGEPLIVSVR